LASAGDAVDRPKTKYIPTGIKMLDYVLCGGLVEGSVVLFAGVPGGGKSTLLMEACDAISDGQKQDVLYASSEESVDRVQGICQRLDVYNNRIKIVSTKNIYEVLQLVEDHKPLLTVFDSLQNFGLGEHSATIQESVEVAKLISEQTQRRKTCSIIINQVGKDLDIKGSNAVPHHVETMLYLYRFDDKQDKKAMNLLSRDLRMAIRRGKIDNDKLRILFTGKNRNGEEKRTSFFMMTKEGQIEPLPQLEEPKV